MECCISRFPQFAETEKPFGVHMGDGILNQTVIRAVFVLQHSLRNLEKIMLKTAARKVKSHIHKIPDAASGRIPNVPQGFFYNSFNQNARNAVLQCTPFLSKPKRAGQAFYMFRIARQPSENKGHSASRVPKCNSMESVSQFPTRFLLRPMTFRPASSRIGA